MFDDGPKVVKNELGQTIVEAGVTRNQKYEVRTAPPPLSPAQDAWQKQVAEYLQENGWEQESPGMWRDPMTAGGNRGVRSHVDDLPKRNTTATDPLFQTVCPPARWDRNTEEAITIQRQRDESAKPDGQLSPLERIDRMSDELKQLLAIQVRVAEDLERLLKRQVPETIQNLRPEVVLVRRAMMACAQRLRGVDLTATNAA